MDVDEQTNNNDSYCLLYASELGYVRSTTGIRLGWLPVLIVF